MKKAIDQLTDTTAKNVLSLSTQISKSQKKIAAKKRRAISGASGSSDEDGDWGKKRYLAKSVNLSFNHF